MLPNPNNGNFSISQAVTDEGAVEAEIWNAVGAKLYKAKIFFKGNKAEMQIRNIAEGTYLLKLTDNKGQRYTIKFTVL